MQINRSKILIIIFAALLTGCHNNNTGISDIITGTTVVHSENSDSTEVKNNELEESEISTILIPDVNQEITTNVKETSGLPEIQETTTSQNTDDEINVFLRNNAIYELENDKIEVSYTGYVEGGDCDIKVALYLFVNGIPQIIEYDNKLDYKADFMVYDKKETTYKCYLDNISESTENITIRPAVLQLPDLIVTDVANYIPCARHVFADGPPHLFENLQIKKTESINDLEGEIDVDGDLKVGFEGVLDRTVLNREGLSRFVIRHSKDELQCGYYIISFWGDGRPIQVGDAMYYRVNLPAGESRKFYFDIDAELLKSITNFYYIIAPEDDGYGTIEKGMTYVFSDKVTNLK